MSTWVGNAVVFMTGMAGLGIACFWTLCVLAAHFRGWYFKRDICLMVVLAGAAVCGLMTALLFQRTGASAAFWVLVGIEAILILVTSGLCWLYMAVKRESR